MLFNWDDPASPKIPSESPEPTFGKMLVDKDASMHASFNHSGFKEKCTTDKEKHPNHEIPTQHFFKH